MRILHLIQTLGYGGAENMLIKLVNQDSENDIFILTMIDECPLKNLIHNKNVIVGSIDDRKSISLTKAVLGTRKVVREFKPDIIQAWMYHSELVGLFVKILNPSVKLFWNIRCSTEYWANLRFRNKIILKLLLAGSRFVSGIIVNSKSELNSSIKLGYPESKLIYIPNGFSDIDISQKKAARKRIAERFSLNEDTPVIGMVARYDPGKDHETLLKAIQILNVSHINVNLILVGSGFTADFTEIVRNYGLDKNVFLFGTTTDVYSAVSGFDIGVLTSKTESFPNVIAEYMLAGLPVVATNVSDIPEIVDVYGSLIPVGDSNKLADSIISILSKSESDREEIGMKARKHIQENYSIEKISQMYNNKYREFL